MTVPTPMRPLLALLVLALCAAPVRGQSVAVEGGNVLFRASPSGPVRRLTSSGLDSQPRLSPDGRLVAFVRATPGDSLETVHGRTGAGSLWLVRTDGRGARELVRGRASDDPRRALADFRSPQFSPGGGEVFFLSSAWATSGAVHALDLASGAVRYVAPGNDLRVVLSGEWAGHLVVGQHRYFLGGGSYDWYWLLTPAGAEVGPVGETPESVSGFLEP